MSIDYTNLFTLLGRDVFWTNTLLAQQNALYLEPTYGMLDDVQDAYSDQKVLVSGFTQNVVNMASVMAGQISILSQVVNATLASLQIEFNAPNSTPAVILPLLYRDMVLNSQTVQKNVIATPVVTPVAGNNGNGVLLTSTLNALGIADERSLTQEVQLSPPCFRSVKLATRRLARRSNSPLSATRNLPARTTTAFPAMATAGRSSLRTIATLSPTGISRHSATRPRTCRTAGF